MVFFEGLCTSHSAKVPKTAQNYCSTEPTHRPEWPKMASDEQISVTTGAWSHPLPAVTPPHRPAPRPPRSGPRAGWWLGTDSALWGTEPHEAGSPSWLNLV